MQNSKRKRWLLLTFMILAACSDNSQIGRIVGGAEALNPGQAIRPGGSFTPLNSADFDGGRPYVPGQIIVKYKTGASKKIRTAAFDDFVQKKLYGDFYLAKSAKLAEASGASAIRSTSLQNAAPINMTAAWQADDSELFSVLKELNSDPDVEYAEPNLKFQLAFSPNDPHYQDGSQWGLDKISAPEAWDITSGAPEVKIAVIDTGVDYDHPDLRDNMWVNHGEIPDDGVDNDGNGFVDDYFGIGIENGALSGGDPMDHYGHGTHCAGIAAAVTDNETGVAGVCPNCSVMAIQFMDPEDTCGDDSCDGGGTLADVMTAFHYAIDNGAKIISCSWSSYAYSQTLADIVTWATVEGGAVVIASAANDSNDRKWYPAALDGVLAVSATDREDRKADFSTYGNWVEVAAPGVDILSTVPTSGTLGDPSGYRYLSGTSMAAPTVAGMAGLLLSKDGTLNRQQVTQLVQYGTDAPDSEVYIGMGRINLKKALKVENAPTGLAEISHPINNMYDGFLPRGSNDVIGTAIGSGYTLSVSDKPYPDSWVVITTGAEVVGDVLGSINTAGLHPGSYYLKLTVDDNVELADIGIFHYDDFGGHLHDGWPQAANAPVLSSPMTYDLDGDGQKEIIFTTYGQKPWPESYDEGYIQVFRQDGSRYPGWPVQLTDPIPATAAVADLDNDGFAEIVAASWGGVYVFHHDGHPAAGWPKIDSTYSSTVPSLADLDGDGTLEIIVPKPDEIAAWHCNGAVVHGWPVQVSRPGGVAIRDLDGDGSPEIVAGTNHGDSSDDNELNIWRADGTLYGDWPRTVSGQIHGSPVIGDMDDDGDFEIIATSKGHINAFHHCGHKVSGWPLEYDGVKWFQQPTLADLDRDGDLEIIFGGVGDGVNHVIEAYHDDATPMEGWPVAFPMVIGNEDEEVAGDIDGDGYPEVVAKVDYRLIAWRYDGTMVEGFPFWVTDMFSGGTTNPFPALSDVDGDQKLEITYVSNVGLAFVFDFETAFAPRRMDWPMYQHDTLHTGSLDNPRFEMDDLLGTWDVGVWSRDSQNELWTRVHATGSTSVASGDLDGDGIDDVIGVWSDPSGLWTRYSGSSKWERLLDSEPDWVTTGDMNGDGRDDILISDELGTRCMDVVNKVSVSLDDYQAEAMAAGDLNDDGEDDLIGVYNIEGERVGLWVRYSDDGEWTRIHEIGPAWIAAGDMNGDGRDDLLGTWPGIGVWYWDPASDEWTRVHRDASINVAAGDFDGDGADDLLGVWAEPAGLWVRYSSDGSWERLSTLIPDWICSGDLNL